MPLVVLALGLVVSGERVVLVASALVAVSWLSGLAGFSLAAAYQDRKELKVELLVGVSALYSASDNDMYVM